MTQQPPAGSQQWAWVKPQPRAEWVHSEPLEYHQLLRGTPRYRWWKPLLALVLGLVYYLTLSVTYGAIVILPYMLFSGDMISEDAILELAIPDTQNPLSLVLTLGSVILMIPAAILAMLSVGLTPAGRLWSVALRIRWRLIGRTVVPAIVALVVMNLLGMLLSVGIDAITGVQPESPPAVDIDVTVAMWSVVILLLLVPAQCAAEELVYRGMFMQILGAWFGGVRGSSGFVRFVRGPWLVILIPAIAFGFSHIYDWWGRGAVVAMAIAAGWVSWRTGGIEAAITLHVVNNLVAFGFMTAGVGGETGQTESGGGLGALLGSIAGLALYAWWVDRSFSRRDGVRTRIDAIEVLRAPMFQQNVAHWPSGKGGPAGPAGPAAPATPESRESPAGEGGPSGSEDRSTGV